MKDWILRYAEQSSEEEEEEEEDEKGGKKKHNPELDEKFDPVSKLKQLKDCVKGIVQHFVLHLFSFLLCIR